MVKLLQEVLLLEYLIELTQFEKSILGYEVVDQILVNLSFLQPLNHHAVLLVTRFGNELSESLAGRREFG